MLPIVLQKQIVAYYNKNFKRTPFIPGETKVPHAQKYFDEKELLALVEASLDGWWTEGHFAEEFEKKLGALLGLRYVSIVNSGSSANLCALFSLTSKKMDLLPKKALKPGDEVITMATCFPTTVNPMIQAGMTPVFIDNDIETANITGKLVENALSKKTRAIMVAHTQGNPFPFDEIMPIVKKHNLWLIEDCCDALGSQYDGKYVGAYGDLATFSFYPAHQITMGEGGAVVTNNPLVHMSIRQFRDWGRDCWCDTGRDNTCRRRFQWQMGKLPFGYDHKYIYSQIGFNLKVTDMQAALGVVQLDKLPTFVKLRQKHFMMIYNHLKKYEKYFILPKWHKKSSVSWFGFIITLRDKTPFTKLELTNFLEENNIATRTLYSGNLLRHPGYMDLKRKRVVGKLVNSDKIMNDGFWIGVHPNLTDEMMRFTLSRFDEFLARYEQTEKKRTK